jgi:hypothetical protein
MPYLFEKEYMDKGNLKVYAKGTVFNIKNFEVLNNTGEWVFDSDSLHAKEYGKVIHNKRLIRKYKGKPK